MQVGPPYATDIGQDVRVTSVNSSIPYSYSLSFVYQGAACSLSPASFDAIDVFPSDQIQIANVINTSSQDIVLSSVAPDVTPVLLEVGEETSNFNGPVKGVWTAEPVGLVGPPVGGCGALAENPPDPIQIAVYVLCVPPD